MTRPVIKLVHHAGGRSAQFLLGVNGLDYAAMAPRLQYYYNYRQSVSKQRMRLPCTPGVVAKLDGDMQGV